jgi:chromatin assembly factor 1 subunit A
MKAAKHAATADDGAFAVPVLPDHAVDGPTPAPSTSASDAVKPRAAPKPKSSFPEALVPTLLAKIKELATGSLVLIVEAAYRDLKAQKVKKNTLEAKIREVSEKAGSPKVWTVKPEVQVCACVFRGKGQLKSRRRLSIQDRDRRRLSLCARSCNL